MKNLITLSRRFGLLIIGALLIQSCAKEYDLGKTEAHWNPNLAIPLGYTSLTSKDILDSIDSKALEVDGKGFITLVYRGHLFSLKAEDFITMPGFQVLQQTINLTSTEVAAYKAAKNGDIYTATKQIKSNFGFQAGVQTQVDSITFKSGFIDFSLTSDFPQQSEVVLTIPGAIKAGKPLKQTFTLNYTGTLPITATGSIDISGYTFNMGGNNQINMNFKASFTKNGNNVTTSNYVAVDQKFRNLAFSKIFGYIGQVSICPDIDTVPIQIFRNSLGNGTFKLVDPRIIVKISNSFGVPISAILEQFDAFSSGMAVWPITGNGIPNPLPINSPTYSQIGQSLTTGFNLNKSNSNIAPIVNKKPKNVIYKIKSLTNPLGKVSPNFVLDTSQIKLDMDIELPMWGTAQGFSIQDTIPFKYQDASYDTTFGGFNTTAEVQSLLFRIHTKNGIPCDLRVQVYFSDSSTNYKAMDSLLVTNQILLGAALVDGNGDVLSSTEKTTDATMDMVRWAKLKKATHIIIRAEASTNENGTKDVRLYDNQRLDVKLGVQAVLSARVH